MAWSAAEDALRATTHRIAMLEDALSEAQSAGGVVNFGARIEKILKLAEDEAREVRSQAEAAAVTLADQTRSQAR